MYLVVVFVYIFFLLCILIKHNEKKKSVVPSNESFMFLHIILERHDALYVVGSLDETLELRGMRYHPIDIETSVIRSHKSIAEW